MLAALDSDGQAINGLHGALARALHHLGRNYAEPIALDTLAGHSNISPSHLSFLFRSEIGIPFKTLLCHIRIHQACSLLSRDDRRTVTDIALSVGFSDLSYFEKSFRRIVGQSPREFRRAQVAAIADPRSRATAALPRLRAGGAR
jgi:AraC-like DNA-binding protein